MLTITKVEHQRTMDRTILDVSELPFTSKYTQALAQHMAQLDDGTAQRAREIGSLAKSCGMLSYEIVGIHAEALCRCVPECGPKEFAVGTAFLTESLRALESEVALQREHALKRAAHELRTPLTTLRLALQVSIGRLEQGDAIEVATLQKSLAMIDKLTAKIAELVSPHGKTSGTSPSPAP